MAIFTIPDGRTHFWQWDKGQRLNINMSDPLVAEKQITEINFSNDSTAGSIRCAVNAEEDGTYSVAVPNTFLTSCSDLCVYAVFVGESEFRTEVRERIPVRRRPKPNDYVYTETLGVTDKSLTMSGIAADALATGEAIAAVKTELENSIAKAQTSADEAFDKAVAVETEVVDKVLPEVYQLVDGFDSEITGLKKDIFNLIKKDSDLSLEIDYQRERIGTLEQQVADILYKPITITAFAASPSSVEIGIIVDEVTLEWSFNKEAAKVLLNGEEVGAGIGGSMDYSGLSISANTTWTLTATDERHATAEKTASLTFLNGVYYGVSAAPEAYDSAFILTLTKNLRSSKLTSISVNAGAGQYIFYCLPKRFGTCSFTVGGFSGGFSLVGTVAFKNASGYTEDYYVYKSDNAGLGSTKVTIA